MSPPSLAARLLTVLWPAFAAAAVIDGIVFSLVDPQDLRWFGESVAMSRPAVYTLAFLIFWALASAASATTWLLDGSR